MKNSKTFTRLSNTINHIYTKHGLMPFQVTENMGIDFKIMVSHAFHHGLIQRVKMGVYQLTKIPTPSIIENVYIHYQQRSKDRRLSKERIGKINVSESQQNTSCKYTLQQCIDRLKELGYTGEIKPIIKDGIKF